MIKLQTAIRNVLFTVDDTHVVVISFYLCPFCYVIKIELFQTNKFLFNLLNSFLRGELKYKLEFSYIFLFTRTKDGGHYFPG